jgi:hypothetical protein
VKKCRWNNYDYLKIQIVLTTETPGHNHDGKESDDEVRLLSKHISKYKQRSW